MMTALPHKRLALVQKMGIAVLGIVAGLALACSEGAGPVLEVTLTPTSSSSVGDTIMGDPTPMPVPDKIGECLIRARTQCPEADLSGADLGAATVAGHPSREAADLSGANLRETNLTGAKLARAKLEGADLTDAILRGAALQSSFLYQANLSGADLTNAVFTFADMEDVILDGAIFCNTVMDDGSIRNDDC